MRTAGPLPAIRLSVAPERGNRHRASRDTQKRPMSSSACRLSFSPLSRSIDLNRIRANDDRFELEVSFAAGRKQIQRFRVHHFECRKRRTTDLEHKSHE
jgi:hypothetical protein